MNQLRNCSECGKEFDPEGTRRRYCSDRCYYKADNRRRPDKSRSNRQVIEAKQLVDAIAEAKGSRNCTNCRWAGKGPRFPFWWDDWERAERNMETAMLLCSKCNGKFCRVKAHEEARCQKWERLAEPQPHIIPF